MVFFSIETLNKTVNVVNLDTCSKFKKEVLFRCSQSLSSVFFYNRILRSLENTYGTEISPFKHLYGV